MRDKEDRLSPRAKKLLEGARRKFSQDPDAARRYLQSVKPKELTMYDRLKIGREILARAPPMSIVFNHWDMEKFQNKIQEAYGLPITKWSMESHKYEPVEPLIGKDRICMRQIAVTREREMIENMDKARNHPSKGVRFWDGHTFESMAKDDFTNAVRAYTLLGMTKEAIRCYDLRIEDKRKSMQEYDPMDRLKRDIEILEEERTKLLKN